MISSREALSSLEQAIFGARREEDRLTEMLRSATEAAARLRGEQAECYKALARLRLDALARDEVVGRLDRAEKAALEVLERRNATLAGLSAERSDLDTALAAAVERRTALAGRLEDAVEAVEERSEQTIARLADDPEWTAKSTAVTAAETKAAAAAEKARQSDADRDEKRKPYEADRLFMYLWKRGYGTSAYRAGPLVRFGDGLVARLIDYRAARPNYFMLNEIPLRLAEHAERLAAAAAAEREGLEALERRALEADGIVELEAAVAAADRDLDAADAEIEEARRKLAAADQRQDGLLDQAGDPDIQQALAGLAEAIARDDLASLHEQAMRTPTPEDERIVKRLREIEQTLARREAEAEEVRKTAVDLARRRRELEHSRDRFRTSGYDDPLGQFANGALIATVIQAVLRGAMSSRNLEDALGDGFSRRRPRSGGSFGGGLRLPGRIGGGGFRTGGGFRGGGFRTGGRF